MGVRLMTGLGFAAFVIAIFLLSTTSPGGSPRDHSGCSDDDVIADCRPLLASRRVSKLSFAPPSSRAFCGYVDLRDLTGRVSSLRKLRACRSRISVECCSEATGDDKLVPFAEADLLGAERAFPMSQWSSWRCLYSASLLLGMMIRVL